MGAWALQKANGGRGILLGGVPGVAPAKVLVLGGGVVGTNAARVAAGMGADVTVLDKSLPRLRYIDDVFGHLFKNGYASQKATAELASQADLIIGAVLVAGAEAPKLISKEQLSTLQPGTALVDVAIDQGGCVETSKPTTHANPTYVVDDVVHYCVANMPGGVPRTSTLALNAVTLPFIQNLASNGFNDALKNDKNFMNGLNIFKGAVTYKAIADDLNYDYANPETLVH